MAEIWGAAIVVAGGIASGMAAEKKDKDDKKYQTKMTQEDYRRTAQQTGYEAALDDYYKQKDRYESQRGLDQFRQFSTITNYKPEYNPMDGQLTAPVMPDYNSFKPADDTPPKSSGGGGGSDIMSKLDPIGSKLFGGL